MKYVAFVVLCLIGLIGCGPKPMMINQDQQPDKADPRPELPAGQTVEQNQKEVLDEYLKLDPVIAPEFQACKKMNLKPGEKHVFPKTGHVCIAYQNGDQYLNVDNKYVEKAIKQIQEQNQKSDVKKGQRPQKKRNR